MQKAIRRERICADHDDEMKEIEQDSLNWCQGQLIYIERDREE